MIDEDSAEHRADSDEFRARKAAYDAQQAGQVAAYGHALQGVFCTDESDGWPFTYTVGRGLSGRRDLIVIGTSQADFLNRVAAELDEGTIELDVPFRPAGGEYQMLVAGIDRDEQLDTEFMTRARAFCPDYTAAIVIFEDDEHRWPWQIDEYSPDERAGLCLGRVEQLEKLVEAAG